MSMLKKLFVAALCVACVVSTGRGEAKRYTGPGRGFGAFENPNLWSPAGVPGENDDVTIDIKNGNYGGIVSITTNVKIASLTIGNGCVLTLFATNNATGGSPNNATLDSQLLVDPSDDSPATFEVTGDLKINNGRIVVGAKNWKRHPEITVGGDFVCGNNTSIKYVYIAAGETNAAYTAFGGGGSFTVKGDTTLTSGAEISPYCHSAHGSGVIFTFRNLEVQSGAKFYAEGRGGFDYAHSPGCSGTADSGSYGGLASNTGTMYGEIDKPYLPGSTTSRADGGGSVRIVATNVVIDGVINVNGAYSVVNYNPSGGAVWIKCKTLAGSGTISADGGSNNKGRFESDGSIRGAGGRIALDVDEPVTDDFNLAVSAAPSCCKYPYEFKAGTTKYTGEPGTIWASRMSTIEAILPRCMGGVFYAPDFPAAFTNSVTAIPSKAYWYFPMATDIVFANDVAFGAGSLLGVGAFGTPGGVQNSNEQPYTRPIGRKQRAEFLGNVSMESNSWIIVNSSRSATKDGLTETSECVFRGDLVQDGNILAYGQGEECVIPITGDWTLQADARVYPICDVYAGTGVRFEVGETFATLEGSQVLANGRGYGSTNASNVAASIAPGRPINDKNGGGAYGGTNGIAKAGNSEAPGRLYGNAFLPFRGGSCGRYSTYAQNPGGGAVRIRAKAVSLAGQISANGISGAQKGYGSSSGGGVMITSSSDSFALAPTAVITANGGSCTTTGTANHNGGGGRIALGIRLWDDVLANWLDQLAALGDVYAEPDWTPGKKTVRYTDAEVAAMFPGATLTATGGKNTNYKAGDGSVCVYLAPVPQGLSVLVR